MIILCIRLGDLFLAPRITRIFQLFVHLCSCAEVIWFKCLHQGDQSSAPTRESNPQPSGWEPSSPSRSGQLSRLSQRCLEMLSGE